MSIRKLNVFVAGYGNGYASFLQDYKLVNTLDEAEVLIFTGGEDVNPALYGAEVHPTTYFTGRDEFEIDVFKEAIEKDNIKLFIGICRGAQLGCVLNGGLLIQDVSGHAIAGGHDMVVHETGEIYRISSLHHQMMYPFNLPKVKYDIIASSSPSMSYYYHGDLIDKTKITSEPEIVLFHGPKKFLAIQGHPEMMNKSHPTIKMINKLIYDMI